MFINITSDNFVGVKQQPHFRQIFVRTIKNVWQQPQTIFIGIPTLDNETFYLSENESTYVNTGVVHRLENDKNDELIIIEVQTGSYLGEDDIIRFEDDYKR